MSTVGLALIGAYWLLVILFIVISLILGVLVFGRARARSASPVAGAALLGFGPAVFGAGAGVERHPGWALLFSVAAILFSLWWLQNMARREP